MCKRHWNEIHKPKLRKEDENKVEPQGKSVYDDILPKSFRWKDSLWGKMVKVEKPEENNNTGDDGKIGDAQYEFSTMMPLAKFLQDNASSEAGWHRRAEYLARGIKPPQSLKCKLEEWEGQIAIIEMALLVGIDGQHSSSDEKYQGLLAHAWGRNVKDFRKNLVTRICSRRGDMSRKQRSDAGKVVPEEKKVISAQKANATKAKRRKLVMEKKQSEGEMDELNESSNDGAKEASAHMADGNTAKVSTADGTVDENNSIEAKMGA